MRRGGVGKRRGGISGCVFEAELNLKFKEVCNMPRSALIQQRVQRMPLVSIICSTASPIPLKLSPLKLL